MEITINSESRAGRAICGIAYTAGTAELYIHTLNRLFNAVLYDQDDLGMDDTEAITTLQALGLLRSDIADIAADEDLARALHADRQMPAGADTTEEEETPDPETDQTDDQTIEGEDTTTTDDREGADE